MQKTNEVLYISCFSLTFFSKTPVIFHLSIKTMKSGLERGHFHSRSSLAVPDPTSLTRRRKPIQIYRTSFFCIQPLCSLGFERNKTGNYATETENWTPLLKKLLGKVSYWYFLNILGG